MRKMLVRGLAVAVLLVLLVPAATTTLVAGQETDASAVLTPIQGLVQVRADTAPEYEWQTVIEPRLIAESDWVQTDNVGLAEITFFDGNLVELLPDSMIQIVEYKFTDEDSPVVTIDESVGDVRHQIDHVLDADSRYEVHTPSAVVAVRGTNFFSSVSWQGESTMNLETGTLAISAVTLDGVIGLPLTLTENQSLAITSDGQPGTPGPYDPPDYPPPAPLAPETCGDAICNLGETDTCVLDCRTSATCGNGICEAESLEGPVTCRVDCVPDWPRDQQPDQPVPTATGPFLTCLISTARGDVIVRVGPGFDRGTRFFLPANTNIPVVGKYTISDGSLWWQIQPPGYLVAEADRYWVPAADVDESGDCSQVPDVPASAVIGSEPVPTVPFVPVQPTQPIVPTTAPVPTQPAPTVAPVSISFYADTYTVNPRKKECATIYWAVEGIREVYYEGRGVTGNGSSVECPVQTTTYTLTVILVDGSTTSQYVTITIDYSR